MEGWGEKACKDFLSQEQRWEMQKQSRAQLDRVSKTEGKGAGFCPEGGQAGSEPREQIVNLSQALRAEDKGSKDQAHLVPG